MGPDSGPVMTTPWSGQILDDHVDRAVTGRRFNGLADLGRDLRDQNAVAADDVHLHVLAADGPSRPGHTDQR